MDQEERHHLNHDSEADDMQPADVFDVSVENVDRDAQVAVGKEIKQTRIGQVFVNIIRAPSQKPIILLILITLASVTGIYFLLLREPRPEKMTSQFNVAVAEFDYLDENGGRVQEEDGLALSTFLYERLVNSFNEFDLASISYEIWPPEYTGRVPGSDREERYIEAEKLAQEINAHLVIYGAISKSEGESNLFRPEFYVNHDAFKQAAEVTGEHQMGKPLLISRPFVSDISGQNPALTARVEALSLITIGLAYYSIDDYDHAISYFEKAAANDKWLRNAGKEIVYVLLGNATQRKAAIEKDRSEFSKAKDNYSKALEINEEFARAKLGEAAMLYALALGDLSTSSFETVNWELLDESEASYHEALTLKDQPLGASIEEKYHFGLGQIYFARSQVDDGNWLEKAEQEYRAVVNEFENGNEQIVDIAGHAYARLALISIIRGDLDTAVDQYNQAISLSSPYLKALYSTSIAEIHASRSEFDDAIEAYEYAIMVAESNGDSESAEKYIDRLNEIRATHE